MKISPLDIQQQQFRVKTFRGLDPEDVDAFLQSIAGEMEELIRENSQMKEDQSQHNREMLDMAEKERELRDTLLSAQRVIEEMKANARKEAELIISEAEIKGERIVADAERQLGELMSRIEEVRRQRIQFEMSFKGLLESFSRQLIGDELV
ncbi:MAG TPA: DivIVA domain-containing protein [Desulfuromonadales bacterium]|nr:DivIVA domain-containing protein [Desulfuromonadales bacterium]